MKVKTITPYPLVPELDAEVMALYRALAAIFEHPWKFELTHWLDGLPSIHLEVHPPYRDLFMYDERVIACVEEHMPTGYVFDGMARSCEPRDDGAGEREYYIYPKRPRD
jgi:hypothetical protein